MNQSGKEKPFLSIILPVYFQEDHIGGILDRYLSAVESLNHRFEIITVVNGTTDRSLEICTEFMRKDDRIVALDEKDGGWGLAVRAGLEAARGEVLCYTNSARTDPHNLVALLALGIARPQSVFKASRRLRYPLARRLGSVLFNFQCRSLFDLAVWDINGTPKVLSREAMEDLDLQESGDLIDLELVVKCRTRGWQIIDVPIVSSERHGGGSTTGLRSAFRMYLGAYRRWKSGSW